MRATSSRTPTRCVRGRGGVFWSSDVNVRARAWGTGPAAPFQRQVQRAACACVAQAPSFIPGPHPTASSFTPAAPLGRPPARLQVIIGSPDLKANHNIRQVVEMVEGFAKYPRLRKLLDGEMDGRRILIFVETKRGCDEVSEEGMMGMVMPGRHAYGRPWLTRYRAPPGDWNPRQEALQPTASRCRSRRLLPCVTCSWCGSCARTAIRRLVCTATRASRSATGCCRSSRTARTPSCSPRTWPHVD